jgi:hypothetical protein
MFDEHVPQPPTAPAGPAKDMFDEIPSNLPFAPTKTAPVAPAPMAPVGGSGQSQGGSPTLTPPIMPGTLVPPMSYEDDAPRGHGFRTVLLVLASIVVIGIAGFLAYKLVIQPKDDSTNLTGSTTDSNPPIDTTEPEKVDPLVEVPVVEPVAEAPAVKDTDGDGLSDDEEGKAGTDSRIADSDRDGLGDREEIQVYGTDPLDPDTDDDSYLDGQEVKSGFNPNGSGKLFEIPR